MELGSKVTMSNGQRRSFVHQRHRRPAHDEQLRPQPAGLQTVGQLVEQVADALRVERGAALAHARSSDRPVMRIPRSRNARGLSRSASARKIAGTAGYQPSVRRAASAAQSGACQPSRSAR